MTKRSLGVGLALLMVVVATWIATRRGGPTSADVASFESRLGDETLLRGSFQAGERARTPAGGTLLVRIADTTLELGPESEALFVSLAPLEVELLDGTARATTAEHEITLRHGAHEVVVEASSEARASVSPRSPGRLEVLRGTARVGDASVTTHTEF